MIKYANIELNNSSCNLSCKLCSVNNKRDLVKDISLKTGFLCELRECNLSGPDLIVSIFGGEPLVNIDELCELLSFTKTNSLRNHVVTNGTLLTDHRFTRLAESGLSDLCVSLDSHIKDVHNSLKNSNVFDIVKRNIKFAIAIRNEHYNKIQIRTNVLVSKANFDHLEDYIDFCVSELKVDGVNLLFLDKTYLTPVQYPFFDELFITDLGLLEAALVKFSDKYSNLINLSEYYIRYIIEYHRRILGVGTNQNFECTYYQHAAILDADGNFKLCFLPGAGAQEYKAYGDLKQFCMENIPHKRNLVKIGKCNNNCFIKGYNCKVGFALKSYNMNG